MLPIDKPIELHQNFPKPQDYPHTVTTLGEAIKKKRIDLRIPKTKLARTFGVNPNTIWMWEDRGKQPLPKNMKKTLDWLGYIPPFGIDETSLGGQLYIYRMTQGLSQNDISLILGINNVFIVNIENGKGVDKKYQQKVRDLLKKNEDIF